MTGRRVMTGALAVSCLTLTLLAVWLQLRASRQSIEIYRLHQRREQLMRRNDGLALQLHRELAPERTESKLAELGYEVASSDVLVRVDRAASRRPAPARAGGGE